MDIERTIVEGPIMAHYPAPPVEGAGAVVTFDGLVRPTENGKPITGLIYESYDAMALKELDRLARATIAQFGVLAIHAIHSKGFVGNGQRSFVLVIHGKHRKECLAAADHFIDAMKKDVPIWKSPVFAEEP
jgi:molybdopterin synthase catalytic subunit